MKNACARDLCNRLNIERIIMLRQNEDDCPHKCVKKQSKQRNPKEAIITEIVYERITLCADHIMSMKSVSSRHNV